MAPGTAAAAIGAIFSRQYAFMAHLLLHQRAFWLAVLDRDRDFPGTWYRRVGPTHRRPRRLPRRSTPPNSPPRAVESNRQRARWKAPVPGRPRLGRRVTDLPTPGLGC